MFVQVLQGNGMEGEVFCEHLTRAVREALQKKMAMQHEALQRLMALLMGKQIDTGNPLVSSQGAGQSSFSSVEKPHFIDSMEVIQISILSRE